MQKPKGLVQLFLWIEIVLYSPVALLLFDLILAEMRMIPKNKHEETGIFSIWHLILLELQLEQKS